MKKRCPKNKQAGFIILCILLLLCAAPMSYAQKIHIFLFGGVNHVLEYGDEGDHVFGENDFPVTPAHTPVNVGASFAFSLNKNLGLELDGRYTLSSKATLQDPSDSDTVEIDTSKHYTVTFNVFYQFLKGSMRPYVLVGAGVDKLGAEDRTYTTEYGYDVDFYVPEKTVDPVANFGGGIRYKITSHFSLRLDFRYILIFTEPDNLSSMNGVFGISIGF
jgi:opacity protein-like surface antigen